MLPSFCSFCEKCYSVLIRYSEIKNIFYKGIIFFNATTCSYELSWPPLLAVAEV